MYKGDAAGDVRFANYGGGVEGKKLENRDFQRNEVIWRNRERLEDRTTSIGSRLGGDGQSE